MLSWQRLVRDSDGERGLWEAATWCDGLTTPRSTELRPEAVPRFSLAMWREALVAVSDRRRKLLSQTAVVQAAVDITTGRILLYLPEESLGDGAAESASSGLLDKNNCPPWDTWVTVEESEDLGGAGHTSFYLASWIPARWIDAVDSGILANGAKCIEWAGTSKRGAELPQRWRAG